jgi:hypothetical protein
VYGRKRAELWFEGCHLQSRICEALVVSLSFELNLCLVFGVLDKAVAWGARNGADNSPKQGS